MIDADLPGRNSRHPRPLLPYNLGRWASLAVNLSRKQSTEVEGYVKPSYVNLCTLQTVYLSHNPSGGLTGIFTDGGEGRSEILLGPDVKKSVRIFGLCERITGGESWQGFAFLQVYAPCHDVVSRLIQYRSRTKTANSYHILNLLATMC